MNILRYVPFFIVPLLIYAVIAIPAGDHMPQNLAAEVLSMPLASGAVMHLTFGGVMVLLAIVFQALEVIRSVRPTNAAIGENMASLILWIFCLIAFLFVRGFGTAEFFIMLLLLLSDYLTDLVVMVFTARRTVATGLNVTGPN